MNSTDYVVDIQLIHSVGATKAWAGVRIQLPGGWIRILGFSVVEKDDKAPWVGFPQKKGKSQYFPILEADGGVRKCIVESILEAYRRVRQP